MTAIKTPHEWSKGALLNKAQRYASLMFEQDRTDWQFGFWSALTLEMLARAALSNISPTLLADGKDWNNLYFALGFQPNAQKFSPNSAITADIFKRVATIFPDFTSEMLNFSIIHLNRRNSELHSGALPFDELGTSAWLPMFYASCDALLKTFGGSMELLFGVEESETANTLIKALQDEAAKAVNGTINAHKTVWQNKDSAEKEKLSKQAEILSTRHIGHRVSCPSCNSIALLQGSPIGAPTRSLEDQIVIEKQPMLPSHFECIACGLKVVGYSKLNACGLGDTYTSTSRYDAAQYFGTYLEDDWPGDEELVMEEDNNEY